MKLMMPKNFWAIYKCKKNYKDEIERFRKGEGSTEQAYRYISKLQNDLDNLLTEEYSQILISAGADAN